MSVYFCRRRRADFTHDLHSVHVGRRTKQQHTSFYLKTKLWREISDLGTRGLFLKPATNHDHNRAHDFMPRVSQFVFYVLFIFNNAVTQSGPQKKPKLEPDLAGKATPATARLTFRAPPAKVAPPWLRPPLPPLDPAPGLRRLQAPSEPNGRKRGSRFLSRTARKRQTQQKFPWEPPLHQLPACLCLGCKEVLLGQVKSGPDTVC